MSDRNKKSNLCLANGEDSLTIFDAPNVCRDFIAKAQDLANHPDPSVANSARDMVAVAKQLLDAILQSADELLALQEV